jgi:hypothetical protein
MARTIKLLSAKKVENAKAKEKKYKLSDGQGLFLQVNPNGSKFWRLSYCLNSYKYFGSKNLTSKYF